MRYKITYKTSTLTSYKFKRFNTKRVFLITDVFFGSTIKLSFDTICQLKKNRVSRSVITQRYKPKLSIKF